MSRSFSCSSGNAPGLATTVSTSINLSMRDFRHEAIEASRAVLSHRDLEELYAESGRTEEEIDRRPYSITISADWVEEISTSLKHDRHYQKLKRADNRLSVAGYPYHFALGRAEAMRRIGPDEQGLRQQRVFALEWVEMQLERFRAVRGHVKACQ